MQFSQIFQKLKSNYLFLFAFLIIYIAFSIYLCNVINIWEDEAYSLNTSSKTISYAFHQSFNFEAQPPVYFVLLTLWRTISDSILWARMFSLVSIIVAQILLFGFIQKIASKKIAAISVILFLLNPFIIFTLLEIRLFAFLLLISIIAIVFFYKSYFISSLTVKNRIYFIIISIIGIFTQYFFGFLLFSLAVVLLFEKNWRSIKFYILDMLVPVSLLIIASPQILHNVDVQFSVVQDQQLTFPKSFLKSSLLIFNQVLVYLTPFYFKVRTFRLFFGVFLLASINYSAIKEKFSLLKPFVILTISILLFFILVQSYFGQAYFAVKYTGVLYVSLFITFSLLFKYFTPRLLNYLFAFLMLFYLVADINVYRGLYKFNEFKNLCNYLKINESSEDPIFVYRNINAEVLTQYYSGVNKIIPLPNAISYDKKFGPEQWTIDENCIINIGQKLKIYNQFRIVIVDDRFLIGFSNSYKLLTEYLFKHFNLKRKVVFKNNLVLLEFSR
jgi:hypothetical protein